jgi:putative hydrolase of the HAD superfamily
MYTNIFFDLDHTLWDFERNSRETLEELFFEFGLNDILNVPVNAFIELYEHENKLLWMDHLRGEISREFLRYERFRKTLGKFEVSDEPLIEGVADYYLEKSPRKTNLFPGAIPVLENLFEKYDLHIITNGFSMVQYTKIEESKLSKYFKNIITSEIAGANKPDKIIFEYALRKASAKSSQSLMIGDTFHADILGAKSIGMDQVWFNPNKLVEESKPTYEINHLEELLKIL